MRKLLILTISFFIIGFASGTDLFQFVGEYVGETVKMYAFWVAFTASLLYFVGCVFSLILKFWSKGAESPKRH